VDFNFFILLSKKAQLFCEWLSEKQKMMIYRKVGAEKIVLDLILAKD